MLPVLGRLSSLLHQAAEFSSQILAADTTEQDEFKEHWKAVTDVIADNGSIITLKERLKMMLKLLHSEEGHLSSQDPGTVGPCLEFLLRHKIMDTLFTAAKSNYPPGMDRQVLVFFTDLLGKLDRPLLHHVSIHQPVLLQVNYCGDDPSGPLCAYQIQFIQTLCVRLKKDPRLADFFMKEDNGNKEFVLLKALLRLANSSNSLVVKKCYECLLECASLQHSSVTNALTTGYLPVTLASKLQYHFQIIPPNLKHSVISSCKRPWRWNPFFNCVTTADGSAFGIQHVEALFSWLDYCDEIIASSQASLGKALCESIHEVFLYASLLPKLLKTKEEEILISTSVLAYTVKFIKCRMLLEECVLFVMKDSCGVFAEKAAADVTVSKSSILDILICRINHINEDVCQVTLQLFDILLQSAFPMVVRGLTNCQSIVQYCILSDEMMRLMRLQLEEDTISYLSLIPNCISSGKTDCGEDFKWYLREAHNEVARVHDLCKHCSTAPCKPGGGVADGSVFVVVLLNKLEAMLEQPYEINLLVASLFTRLAAAPFPSLKWLFQTDHQERNVYTILKKVAGVFMVRVERTPGLVVHIVEARRRLEGQLTSDLLSMPHNDLLEGAIVLVEFIKELCSIMYANTSWSILSLPAPSSSCTPNNDY